MVEGGAAGGDGGHEAQAVLIRRPVDQRQFQALEADLLFATTVDRRLIVIDRNDAEFFWERLRVRGAQQTFLSAIGSDARGETPPILTVTDPGPELITEPRPDPEAESMPVAIADPEATRNPD